MWSRAKCRNWSFLGSNKMNNKILRLRISFWVGAIADAIVGIAMLCPSLVARAYGLDNFNPGNEYKVAMGMGASLMLGWAVLLLWADRKPLKRKGILLITIFPAIAGLMATGVYAVNSGFIAFEQMLPTWIFQLGLIGLFLFSYFKAGK